MIKCLLLIVLISCLSCDAPPKTRYDACLDFEAAYRYSTYQEMTARERQMKDECDLVMAKGN